MSRIDQVQEVIHQFGAEMGTGSLQLDEEGQHRTLVSGMPVTFLYSQDPVDVLWLFVDIADVPDHADELQDLLRFGFSSWISNQMTLGLDETGKRLVGFTSVPAAVLSADNLKQVLERLLTVASTLVDRIKSGECHACGTPVEQCECTPMTAYRV